MMPDGGEICERVDPPWQESGRGHRILCHIPMDKLKEVDPVIHKAA